MRLALLSDIHGNLPALQAVMADLAGRGVDRVINLGDSLSGPLLPQATAECLMAQDWIHLAGNHERQVLTQAPERMNASDAFARARLDQATLRWIAGQRPSLRLDDEDFLDTVTPQGMRLATAEEIAERRAGTPARLIACGHTHTPRLLRAPDGCLLLNPGSVGLPGYDDDHPFWHWVDNGSPDARYAIAERGPGGLWTAQLLNVPYDHTAMAALAHDHGREDWAHPLSTGYALRPAP
jgi:predicted phosphodiesterase